MGTSLGSEDRRYRKLRDLGSGAFGTVTLVEDSARPGRLLALKQLTQTRSPGDQTLRAEFALLATLKHPNLVEVVEFDFDPETGSPRFTMPFVPGDDIVATARREGSAVLLELAAEALRALTFLHDFGVVHQDLKPANILVRPSPSQGGRLVLLDFGLSLTAEPSTDKPRIPGIAGTLQYIAPEIIEGFEPGPRSDLYGLGAVLFEAIHGVPLFDGSNLEVSSLIESIRAGERSPRTIPAGYPEGLARWLEDLICRDPAARPATAAEALTRLSDACGTTFTIETADSRRARLASGSPPGRNQEIDRLWGLLKDPASARLVWLCGGPGSGKTRILRWVEAQAVLRGWQVMTREALVTHPSAIDTLIESEHTHQTLILLDDSETIDVATAQSLERIVQHGKSTRVSVIATIRSDTPAASRVGHLLTSTANAPSVHRIDLVPLGESQLREMVERATGGAAVSATRLAWLEKTSEGNPLVAESLLVEGVWEERKPIPIHNALRRTVEDRVRALPVPVRRLLEVLCILGPDTPWALVQAVAGPLVRNSEIPAEVLRTGLAQERRGRWSPDSATVLEVTIQGMDPRERERAHLRAAKELGRENFAVVDLLDLARHWAGARKSLLAIETAVLAADRAEATNDPHGTARACALALQQLGRARDPRRVELRRRQGLALRDAGNYVEAIRALSSAAAWATSPREKILAHVPLAWCTAGEGRLGDARRIAEVAQATAERESALALHAEASKVLGVILGRLGSKLEAIEQLRTAAAGFRQEGNTEGLAETLTLIAYFESRQGLGTATDRFLEALELCRLHGYSNKERSLLLSFAQHCARIGETDDALKLGEQVRRRAENAQDHAILARALSHLSQMRLDRGEYDQAVALAQENEDHARHFGYLANYVNARNARAEALAMAGRPMEAAAILRETLAKDLGGIEPRLTDYVNCTLVEALLELPSSDGSEVQTRLSQALESCEGRGDTLAQFVLLVVDAERRLALGEDTGHLFERLSALREKENMIPSRYRVRADLAHATFTMLAGALENSKAEAADVVRLAQECDHPDLAARAYALASEALELKKDIEEATHMIERGRQLLDEAAERIQDLDMRRDFLARPVFRRLRDPDLLRREAANEQILALYNMIHAINSEPDTERLLASILDSALNVVRAERGMILLLDRERGEFAMRLGRNLEAETIRDAEAFSQGVVARAGAGESVLAMDAGIDDRFKNLQSVSLFGIRSLMCVPLRARGEIIGTVYVDSRTESAPFNQDDLRFVEALADHAALALDNARASARLQDENARLQAAAERRSRFANIVGASPQMHKVFELAEKVAASELSVLIQGESGTGKELVANAIHFNSSRRKRAFVSESCATIPETLLESELFGHVRGAFTGAERDRPGLFEQADGGTLFLDEVGDMSPAMQARLLRVLQEGELRRVGGDRPIDVDVRVLAASHKDLQDEVRAGRFREDLLYRLQVLVIPLPPLRERAGDIPLLVAHFLKQISEQRGQPELAVEREVLELFERYRWPGNVRQLENLMQRLALLAGSGPITRSTLESDPELARLFTGAQARFEPTYSLAENERERIRLALRETGGIRNRAARLLGISRATLYRKLKQYDLE